MTSFVELPDVRVAYAVDGDHSARPLVLIHGLGTQMTEWSEDFVERLVQRGYRVIRFDNRDCGLSSGFEDHQGDDPAYSVSNMAADVISLLDHLGIERADVFGISMGGMIVQALAIEHGSRLRCAFSVMSSTGNPELPRIEPHILAALLAPPPQDMEEAILVNAANRALFGSPGYPESEEERIGAARAAVARAWRPDGVGRQYRAILADGSRVERLATVATPMLVIHGRDDPLVPLAGGEDTARCVPGARLEVIDGMGHNLPDALLPRFVDLIDGFCALY